MARRTRRPLAILVGLLVAAGCETGTDAPAASSTSTASRPSPALGEGVPATFLAVRDFGTEIVEVETATLKVLRTVVDHGPYRESETNTYVESLDLSPDGDTLYYGTVYRPVVIHRLRLPDGRPERIADGRGPSVSPDGRRLAFVRDSSIVIRDLSTGEDRVFDDLLGELGGGGTSWSGDSRYLAYEAEGADVVAAEVLDTATGRRIDLHPGPELPAGYYAPYAYSPRFRATDGLLGAICCGNPDPAPDHPDPSRLFIIYDPLTGEEKDRFDLPFGVGAAIYDRTGRHQLLAASDDAIYLRTDDGVLTRLGSLNGVTLLAW